MKNGGICGMPTDTVYVLVAACNQPNAVVKAYKCVYIVMIVVILHSLMQSHYSVIAVFDVRVKKQAEDRPMSMWISSIKQLEPVRHLLSPLLLDFMEAAWPSSISMVIPRGSSFFVEAYLYMCVCSCLDAWHDGGLMSIILVSCLTQAHGWISLV